MRKRKIILRFQGSILCLLISKSATLCTYEEYVAYNTCKQ